MSAPAQVRRAGQETSSAAMREIQRTRLLNAAVSAIDELGYSDASISHITGRARISRRTFYELFPNREDCLLAVIEDALGSIRAELDRAGLSKLRWAERVREGLYAILAFLDREPALARVCVVESGHGGRAVRELRERTFQELAAILDQGRLDRPGAHATRCTMLTAEGLVSAAFGLVYSRLSHARREPLVDLLGELSGLIVLTYRGPAAARREQVRAASARPRRVRSGVARAVLETADPLAGVPMRMTYRTMRILEGIAEHPGASNRSAAEHAGISDPGQVSRLLSRLQRLGLIVNGCDGRTRGEPNAWSLTSRGERLAQSVRPHFYDAGAAA